MRPFLLFHSPVATGLTVVGILAVPVAGLPGWEPLVASIIRGTRVALPGTPLAMRAIAQLQPRQADRNAATAASKSRGLSAWSQWPAPGNFANFTLGNNRLISGRCAGCT